MCIGLLLGWLRCEWEENSKIRCHLFIEHFNASSKMPDALYRRGGVEGGCVDGNYFRNNIKCACYDSTRNVLCVAQQRWIFASCRVSQQVILVEIMFIRDRHQELSAETCYHVWEGVGFVWHSASDAWSCDLLYAQRKDVAVMFAYSCGTLVSSHPLSAPGGRQSSKLCS